jgi:hypothetical protein
VSCDAPFVVGATAADAPLAIASDTPAAPNTGNVNAGKVGFRRFRFETCFACAIAEPSYSCEQMLDE